MTASPEPAPADPELAQCGTFDAALARVAQRTAERSLKEVGDIVSEELAFDLRTEGEPHAWPEAWTFSHRTGDGSDVKERAMQWLGTLRLGGERRCGSGRAHGPGGTIVVALVVVGALADLSPIPTKARLGQWIRFDASLLVEAEGARIVVLPPKGPPRTMPTTLHGRTVAATFSADQQGPWLVQLVANVEGGPRPLLEAAVFVDDEPVPPSERMVPGEGASSGARDEREALEHMINAARRTEGLRPLAISTELRSAAGAHARAMRDAGILAHDVGRGGPVDRMREAGIDASRPGENVAHARSIERAHRLLWASPSHRGNLLDPRFSKLGVAVERGADGSVWVCETFADSDNAGIEHRRSEY